MSGYLFQGKLDNTIHEICYCDIVKLREENLRDKLECEQITQSRYSEDKPQNSVFNRLDFYREFLADMKTTGFVMNHLHGQVILQAERNHYYRGENQLFKKSISSLLRKLNEQPTGEKREIYRFISDMRIAQFRNFLLKFEHVHHWHLNYSDVLFDVIAQHYGFETSWLDITNDFDVALFFATCYFDGCEKQWKPLTKEQTEKCEATKYGMIFHMPAWRVLANNMSATIEPHNKATNNIILPIGFQPFMRCHMQYGYAIDMQEEFPLQQDIGFEKLKFRHSEELSNEIYEKMEKGNLIYPHEGLSEFDDVIKTIQNASHFTEDEFEYAFERSNFFKNKDECKNKLTYSAVLKSPVIISDSVVNAWTVAHENLIKRTYENFSVEDAYGIKLGTRKIFYG